MATLQQAIDRLQELVGAIDGIREAPDEPPENIAVFPFAVAYASGGRWESVSSGWAIAYHTITLELHVSRRDLPRDVQKAMAYSESVIVALYNDPTLDGTVELINEPIAYTFGPLGWGNTETLGFSFSIPVKQKQTVGCSIMISGVSPQLDDTDKLAVSLYAEGAAAGDTRPHAVAGADGASNALEGLIGMARGVLFNGTTWDRQRNNQEVTLLASAARTASTASSAQTNYNARGIVAFFNIAVVPGGDTVTLRVRGKDPIAGTARDLLVGSALSSTGSTTYIVYPGVGAAANGVSAVNGFVLPRTWDLAITHSGAGSFTYSVGASYIL